MSINNTPKLPDDISPTFCAIPFVGMLVNTDTTIQYCCMANGPTNKLRKEDNTPYTIADKFVDGAWNSNGLKDIRLAMVDGKKVSGCNKCYMQESTGRDSNRIHANREWQWRLGKDELHARVTHALNNSGEIKDDLVYLDLRLGNLCNLKCRMCNPWNSSQIAKEHLELNATNPGYSTVWKKNFGVYPVEAMDNQKWFEHDIFWDQVIDLIPSLKKVYMTGGEPTLISHNAKFMEECITRGRSDIVLFFNTNCTNINKKFLNNISKFSEININASMDGVGIVNDYIRSPSKWSQISTNIEQLAEMPNVVLGITLTVQVYNIFNLIDILNWVDDLNVRYSKNIFIDFLINMHPNYLNVNILPDDIREEVAQQLITYRDTKITANTHHLTANSLNGIIGLLQKPRVHDWAEQIEHCKVYTKALDVARNQTITDVDVRLAKFLNE